jgi:hypothetical protein
MNLYKNNMMFKIYIENNLVVFTFSKVREGLIKRFK